MRGISLIVAVAVVLTLAGCGSTSLRYYTLVKPALVKPAGPGPVVTAGGYAIEVLPVTVPAQVDQPQLVLRTGAGELALAEDRQWLAPLGDEIRAALSAELTARLGVQDVYRLAQIEGQTVYRIRVDVRRFESSLGKQASVEAVWRLETPQKKNFSLSCSSRAEETVTSGYPAMIEGHQRALNRIADQIAETVQRASTGATVSCP